MAKVLGVGGVFFKSENPEKLLKWYEKWLGFELPEYPGCNFFPETMPKGGFTVFGPFKSDTNYFDPSKKEFMFNLVVDNLDDALKQVAEGGAELVGEIEEYDFGRFGWFIDPDNNKVELWETK